MRNTIIGKTHLSNFSVTTLSARTNCLVHLQAVAGRPLRVVSHFIPRRSNF